MKLKPKSVLDVGCGVGMYGMLCRATCMGVNNSHGQGFQDTGKFNSPRVDAVEIWPAYKAPWHLSIYTTVWWGVDVCDLASRVGDYVSWDVAIAVDVLEHLPKQDAKAMLQTMPVGTWLIVTPPDDIRENAYAGNPFERHVSSWEPPDFPKAPFAELIPPRFSKYAKPKLCVVWSKNKAL